MSAPAKNAVEVRLLTPDDNRKQFDCGDIEANRFFPRFAGQNQFRHHIGTTYVAVHGTLLAGFATVSPGELTAEAVSAVLRKKLPAYPIPILRIARLGVDQHFRKLGIGRLLLRAMFELAVELQAKVGCAGVVVDAKMDAVAFYEALGFMPLGIERGALGDRPAPLPMFLPLALIGKARQTR